VNPPRPLPTLATVQAAVEATLRELRGARIDIDALKTESKAIRAKVLETEEIIRISRLPGPSSLSPVPAAPQPRPSMAARAAQSAPGKVGAALMIGTGALTVAGQIVALWKPEYTGPIFQALRLLASLGGGDP
jgi:hypothetical protein